MNSRKSRHGAPGLVVVILLAMVALFACAQSAPTASTPASTAKESAAPAKASAPPAQAAKPIKVSIGMDHTGATSGATLHQFRGAEHYYRWINEQGGIDGVPLDVLWADTQYKVPVDVEYYKRARDQGSVVHMMTGTASGVALAEMAAEDKMAVLNTAGDHLFLVPPRTILSANVPFAYQAGTALKWFLDNWKENRPPRLVWLGWDNPAIKGPAALIEPRLGDKLARADGTKFEWAGTVLTAMRAPDFSTYLLKAKELKPDVVVFGMDPVDVGALARDAQRLGLTKEWQWIFLNSAGFGPDAVKIAGPEAIEGWLLPSPFEAVTANLPGATAIKQAQDKFQGFVYDDQNYVQGWVTASMAVEAIKAVAKQSGTAKVDRASVLDALFRIKDLNTGGLTSPASLAKDKLFPYDAIKLWRIKDGKPVVATDWIKITRFADGL